MDNNNTASVQKENPPEKYTSVLYVHGMGEQRRYEEVSRLVESLDKYTKTTDKGILTKIRARMEPAKYEKDETISYIRAYYRNKEATESDAPVVRFYEMYWAPICAGGIKAGEVMLWLVRQFITPLKMIMSPWRSHQRLRRAALFSKVTKHGTRRMSDEEKDAVHQLIRLYDEFDRPDLNEKYQKGIFKEFLGYIRESTKGPTDELNKLLNLVKEWKRFFIVHEIKTIIILFTLFLGVALGFAAAVGAIFYALHLVAQTQLQSLISTRFSPEFYNKIAPSWPNAITLAVLLCSLFGIKGFLEKFLGDVQFWTTYEETDEKYSKRRAILEKGFNMLLHLLDDEQCDRIVVVAHSLGTSIAMDTLLHIGRYNRARNRQDPMSGPLSLEKITHFITLASPVDKIHYFFESYQAKYQRYRRVVEEIRGDIGEVPFAKNRKPHIHWLNFWDKGDIISGPLESPSNSRITGLQVDNIHVTNYLYPAPGACHTGYFTNRFVVGVLFDIIFSNAFTFSELPLIEGKGYDYNSAFLGPGKKWPAIISTFHTLMFLVPWTALLCISGYFLGWVKMLTHALAGVLFAEAFILALFGLVHLRIGNVDSLKPVKKMKNG